MSKRNKWILIGVGIFVVLIIIGAVASTGSKTTKKPKAKPTAETQEKPKAEAAVGQPVKSGDRTITVVSWAPSNGDNFSTPAAGNQFIVVDLDITNNGAKTYDFSTMLMLSIRTPEGREYDQAPYFPEPKFPDGAIAAGQKARGNVAFEVPGQIGSMSFVFKPLTGDQVSIKLQ